MKRIVFFLLAVLSFTAASADNAQEARKILDKTASIVGSKKGAQASFQLSSGKMKASGNIYIKGAKFYATTSSGSVWFDGKTQWSYLKSTEEVNISTPSQAQQMSMNPLTFINMYKKGFNLSVKTIGNNYEVRLVGQGQKGSVSEMYIVINKSTYVPSQVRMRQKQNWVTVNISNFKAVAQNDAIFQFSKSKCPGAEIIDLR